MNFMVECCKNLSNKTKHFGSRKTQKSKQNSKHQNTYAYAAKQTIKGVCVGLVNKTRRGQSLVAGQPSEENVNWLAAG